MRMPALVAGIEAEDAPHDVGFGFADGPAIPRDTVAVIEDRFAAIAVGQSARTEPVARAALQAAVRLLSQVAQELFAEGRLDAEQEPAALGVLQCVHAVRPGNQPDAPKLKPLEDPQRVGLIA